MGFTQVIEIEATDAQAVSDLLATWHADQHGVAPGYEGYRLLSDRDQPHRHTILVDFTSYEEAQQNDGRAETHAWSAKLRDVADGTPRFRNFETVATTS